MIIKIETLLQYLLILIAFFYHGSLIEYLYPQVIAGISICIILICYLRYNRSIDKSSIGFVVCLALNILFVRLINHGGVGLTVITKWAIEILSVSAAYFLNKDFFITRFIKTVVFYASLSSLITIFNIIFPGVWSSNLPLINYQVLFFNIPFHGILPLHILSDYGDKFGRNCCIFTEPGLFQIILNTALYFLIISKKSIYVSRLYKKYSLIIIAIAILLCKSTTGYIGFSAILCTVFLTGEYNNRFKVFGVAIIVSIALGLDYFSNGEQSVIYSVVLSKVFTNGSIDLAASTGIYRLNTLEFVNKVMHEKIFGVGFDKFTDYLNMWGYSGLIAGMAFVASFAYYGIQMALFYGFLFIKAYKQKYSIAHFILILFLYLNTTLAQTEVFYPALYILFIIDFREQNNQRGKLIR